MFDCCVDFRLEFMLMILDPITLFWVILGWFDTWFVFWFCWCVAVSSVVLPAFLPFGFIWVWFVVSGFVGVFVV